MLIAQENVSSFKIKKKFTQYNTTIYELEKIMNQSNDCNLF